MGNDTTALVQENHYDVWREPLVGIGVDGDWNFLFQGKEYVDFEGLNLYDFHSRFYDPWTGRFWQIDGADQFASGYVGMGNMPTIGIDPDGQLFFIIPQIGWSLKGGFSFGLEFGVGVPGVLSASLTLGYNTGNNSFYGSVQGYASGFYAGYGTDGGFAGWGYRYAGLSAGVSYGREGFGVGVGYGGTSNNFNGALGLGWSQKGGFDINASGGYTQLIEKAQVNKIAEYNLAGASLDPMQQRGEYDCLVCASTYIDQLYLGRSYEDILDVFGELYDPQKGTSTQAALERLYGEGNVKGFTSLNPLSVGRSMEQGNPSIIAQNSNHAVVPVKIEIFSKTYKYSTPKSVMSVRYMNPATGGFGAYKMVKSLNYPTFIIKLKR